MSTDVAVLDYASVMRVVTPERAIECVRDGFIRYAKDEWSMPAKVYLDSAPHGDFRAMPASGDGLAILKWVTSFPSNATRNLPTVTGTIIASDAETGRWLALIDGRSVTALRTGAAAAIASQALESDGAQRVGLIGCGLHGRWAGACLKAAGYEDGVCADVNPTAAQAAADELGWSAGSVGDALECEVITLVTPGYEPVIGAADLRPGMHINALGADGPGKAEMEVGAVELCELYCDEWRQASHGGELTGAAGAGLITEDRVTELGAVLTGQS
ncbi:MAG: ornithine cyclodeaminase family protein, partial [Actinomycetota bacterium]